MKMLGRANLVGTVWLDIEVPYGRSAFDVLLMFLGLQGSQSFLA